MGRMVNLIAEDCVKVGGDLYFIASNFNLIFKLEISTGNIDIVGSIPEEKILSERLSVSIVSYEDYMFFAPMSAKKIWRYSISANTWKSYELKRISDDEKPYFFMASTIYNNKIFFVGGNYPAIVRFDLETEEICYIEKPFLERAGIKKDLNDIYFRKDYVLHNNCMYLASCLKNEILKLNLDTYDYEYITVGEEGFRYSGIGYDGKNFFLSPRKNTPAVRWDGESQADIIHITHVSNADVFTTWGVMCREDGTMIFSCVSGENYNINNKGAIDCHILDEAFWLRKCLDDKTYIDLTTTEELVVVGEGAHYQYNLCLDSDKIAAYLANEMKKQGEDIKSLSDEIFIEEKKIIDLDLFIRSF